MGVNRSWSLNIFPPAQSWGAQANWHQWVVSDFALIQSQWTTGSTGVTKLEWQYAKSTASRPSVVAGH